MAIFAIATGLLLPAIAHDMAVDGVVGLYPVENRTCAAVWIPIPETQALAGLMWYNNDELVVYPEVLLESGTPGYPVGLDDCRVVAQDVQGVSLGWSTIAFDEVARCLSEGLYVLFRFPEGSEYSADGAGGGAALGYTASGEGYPGWISANGEDWISFAGTVGFAVEPIYVDASEATIVMLGRSPQGQRYGNNRRTDLFRPAPNPSNPGTTIEFSLAKHENVELSIFNIRGIKIRTLVDEMVAGGNHSVYWDGRDDSGRDVASGVYFARLSAEAQSMTQKLVLIR